METKGVTCKIPLDLHNRISEEIRETESTMSKFIEMIIQEHYEKGAGKVMAKGRTLAFQVSEELFQRVKEYLERFEKVHHRRLTQKEFIIGLIEQALEEAEEEFEAAEAAGREEQEESAWAAAQGEETGEDEGDPSTGLPSEYAAWSAPQEDGQETADGGEVDAESETVETEDAGETEEAEEEIYAYGVEWQVLNSKDFGVPQSRKRVYLVGYLDERCRGKILPFTETAGTPLKQIRPGAQGERVYSTEGVSCTLAAQAGGFGGRTGLYCTGVPIKENTKKGYKMAYPGDSVDLAYPTLNTRRGRVGRKIAHTITTGSSQGTLCCVDMNEEPELTDYARCLTAKQNGGIRSHKREASGVWDGCRIRRLTPRECLRLQGWTDDRIDLVLPLQSDAQLYKQAGNGVTVNVVEAIGKRLAAAHREVNAVD